MRCSPRICPSPRSFAHNRCADLCSSSCDPAASFCAGRLCGFCRVCRLVRCGDGGGGWSGAAGEFFRPGGVGGDECAVESILDGVIVDHGHLAKDPLVELDGFVCVARFADDPPVLVVENPEDVDATVSAEWESVCLADYEIGVPLHNRWTGGSERFDVRQGWYWPVVDVPGAEHDPILVVCNDDE